MTTGIGSSPSKQQCEKVTVTLLKHLQACEHKASHVRSREWRSLSPKCVAAVQNIPKPVTKKQLMSFLGIASYCRNFIPNYSFLEAQLGALIHGKGLQSADHVQWTSEAEAAFTQLKLALYSVLTLGIPDPTKPFTQAVDENHDCMTSILLQEHGGKQCSVAYFSAKVDSVAAGLPGCLRAVAAAEKAVLPSRDNVGYANLTVLVHHSS